MDAGVRRRPLVASFSAQRLADTSHCSLLPFVSFNVPRRAFRDGVAGVVVLAIRTPTAALVSWVKGSCSVDTEVADTPAQR